MVGASVVAVIFETFQDWWVEFSHQFSLSIFDSLRRYCSSEVINQRELSCCDRESFPTQAPVSRAPKFMSQLNDFFSCGSCRVLFWQLKLFVVKNEINNPIGAIFWMLAIIHHKLLEISFSIKHEMPSFVRHLKCYIEIESLSTLKSPAKLIIP